MIRRAHLPLIIVLAIGLAVRIVFLVQLDRSELGGLLPLDMRFYRELALAMVSGKGIPGGVITFNPLYPFFLALIFRVFGDGLLAVRAVQSAVGLATIALAYAAGRRLADSVERGACTISPKSKEREARIASMDSVERGGRHESRGNERGPRTGEAVGLVAAALVLLYPHFLLYEGSLLATTLVAFILLAVFTLALAIDGARLDASRRYPLWLPPLGAGFLIGAGSLGRPNLFFLLVPAFPLWIALRDPLRRRGVRNAVIAFAAAAAVIAPPILYNASHTGRFVPVTTHGGINFYIGNRPESRGMYDPPAGMRSDMRGIVEDARLVAEQRLGRSLSDAEASDYWFGESIDWISRDPVGWIRLLARKLLLFFNGVEIADVLDLSFYREACPVMKLLVLPFAVISPLSILGMIVLARSGRNRSAVFLFIGASIASVLLFYVNSRYRLPAVPLLILPAAVFLVWFVQRVARRSWRSIVLAACCFAALAVLVSGRRVVAVNRSAMYNFLGNHYVELGETARAEKAFAEAYRHDPENVATQINYARILLKLGRLEESRRLYAEAYASDPGFPVLAIEYGSLLDQMGRREEAERLYRSALDLPRARDRVLACKHLARDAMADGKRDEAIAWIRRALEMTPGDRSLVEWLNALEGER